jgi:hypothetical protein
MMATASTRYSFTELASDIFLASQAHRLQLLRTSTTTQVPRIPREPGRGRRTTDAGPRRRRLSHNTISTAASEQGMASRVEGGREVVHIEKRWQPWWTPLRPAPVVRPPI